MAIIRFVVICFLLSIGIPVYAENIQKVEKRILYVGYSPDRGIPAYSPRLAGYASKERFEKDVRTRMTSFKKLLSCYFSCVETVDARDYRQEMSREYDVTVFDALPVPIVPQKDIRDENGKYLRTQHECYLGADFDCPAVFLTHTGGVMREGLDLKIDWCCLCLDAFALHLRLEHQVFKGPFAVAVSCESRETPLTAYNYLNGLAEPDRISMWRVQKDGYRDGKGQRIGLVAFGDGFGDSPDAEVISGGLSLKAINAVAIGRHGNFLLWGFGASPEDMTVEAQAVFANCVDYISKFKGKRPVMRKAGQAITVRSYVDDLLWVVSPHGYERYVHKKELVNADRIRQKEEMKKRVEEKGEPVNDAELDKKYSLSEIWSREEFYRKYLGDELGEMAVRNREKCRKYIASNRPYFYGAGTFNRFVIDEDVRSVGVANNSKRLLEKCITILKKGRNTEIARRILLRYTNHQFDTPREWEDWYVANRDILFFTEAGGYKFIENAPQSEVSEIMSEDDGNPVEISSRIIEKNGKRYAGVQFRIKAGFHIYATLGKGAPFVPTTVVFEFSEGIEAVGGLIKPKEVLLEGGEEMMVYKKEAEFLQEISGAKEGYVKCTIGYQCCDAMICMPPEKKEITIQFPGTGNS